MIRPLVSIPTPPAKPKDAPAEAAPVSFLDWVMTKGVPPTAQPGATPQPGVGAGTFARPEGAPAPQENGLPNGPFSARERTNGPSAPAMSLFAPPSVATESAGLALRIEHRAGPVEVIALPWRLMATGGLAHVFGLGIGIDAIVRNGMHAQGAGGAIPTSGALAPGQIPGNEPTGQADRVSMASTSFAAGTAIAAERFDEAASDARVRADAPSVLPWVARLLRWLDDHGEATLWVRDFRLDEGDKRALVDTLRAAAAQSGLRLDRIVINGRAHWHVHRPTRESSHAG